MKNNALAFALFFILILACNSLVKPTPTPGPLPQPSAPITAQTMDRVRELYRIPQPGFAYDVAWSPDGLILAVAAVGSGSEPGSVQLWDAITGHNLRGFEQVSINRLAFSPDGKMLAASDASSLIVWDAVNGREMSNIELAGYGTASIAFSSDGRILAYRLGDQVTLLEMPGGRELKTFQQEADVLEFAFLPDRKSLITAAVSHDPSTFEPSDTTFTVWDLDSGQPVRTFTQPGSIDEMTVAPDGKSLAAGIDSSTLKVWDLASGQELQLFTGFRFGVPCFAFSPDGSVLAAGEGVGFEAASPSGLRLFAVASGREVPMLQGHEGVIFSVAFSPDGRFLATASEDKTVRLWGVPPDQ